MTTTNTLDGGPLPIDLEHLSQYTANDPEITRDILRLFIGQLSQKIENLKATEELSAWKAEAHALKGSSLGVGAQEMADLALEAEGLSILEGAPHAAFLERLETAATRTSQYAHQLLEDASFVG